MTIDPAKPTYQATADAVAVTPAEFAGRTSTDSRYVRESLAAQAFAPSVEPNPLFSPDGLQLRRGYFASLVGGFAPAPGDDAVARPVRESLADEGTWLILEPFAQNRPAAETPFNIVLEVRA
jgi:hypothetical protein